MRAFIILKSAVNVNCKELLKNAIAFYMKRVLENSTNFIPLSFIFFFCQRCPSARHFVLRKFTKCLTPQQRAAIFAIIQKTLSLACQYSNIIYSYKRNAPQRNYLKSGGGF